VILEKLKLIFERIGCHWLEFGPKKSAGLFETQNAV
jgi:hypothetical protein